MAETIISGLVVQKKSVDTYDEYVTLLTNTDRVQLLARGTRKIESKNGMVLQLGNFITAEIFKSRLEGRVSRLKRATISLQPPLLTSDVAQVMFEILKLIQNAPKSTNLFFDLTKSAYAYFGNDYNHHVKTFIFFHALELWGLKPRTDMCVRCGKTDKIVDFNFDEGGFLCSAHSKNKQPLEYLQAIRSLKAMFTYRFVDPGTNQQVFSDLYRYYQAHVYF